MLRSIFCDCSNAYIPFKVTITVKNTTAEGRVNNTANQKVLFKSYVQLINCVSSINNTHVDDAMVLMSM